MSITPEEKSKRGTPEILPFHNVDKRIMSFVKDAQEKEISSTSVRLINSPTLHQQTHLFICINS